ncbi:MAG: hypothetical protein ACI9FB_000973 [Candidatus Azotimanducaceae bacterium]|jgi:hypothetical protein
MSEVKPPSLPDLQRLKQVSSYHGLRITMYLAAFGAADAWFEITALPIAGFLAIVVGLISGSYLARTFHEWGHFIGARVSKSRSPIVRIPEEEFIFGFDMVRNSSSQFLSMSLGGPLGNLALIALVFFCIPLDSIGRAALFAMVVGKLVSVLVFEGPIILRSFQGGNPQEELDRQLGNGSQDRGQVFGYIVMTLLWVLTI